MLLENYSITASIIHICTQIPEKEKCHMISDVDLTNLRIADRNFLIRNTGMRKSFLLLTLLQG